MINLVSHKPGLSAPARAGVALVAALAAVCVTAGPGLAATDTDDCTVSDPVDGWTTTRCDSTREETVSKTWSLKGLETVNLIDAMCGVADGYRFYDEDFSYNRLVPKGVEIVEPGGVGATGLVQHHLDGYAAGVHALSLTNWSVNPASVTVTLHCTPDGAYWYK